MNREDSADAGAPVVAAFDFDGTLSDGGSVWQFLVAVAGRWRATLAGIREAPKILFAAILGGTANDRAKEALFVRILGGQNASDISRKASAFGISHFDKRVRPEVYERLLAHERLGHKIVIVSASPEIYLVPVAQRVGASKLVATRMAVGADGNLTGRYEGLNCRGHEKWRRLNEWIQKEAAGSYVWAYGNSAGDREMLRNADRGVDVGKLGRFGKLRDFLRLKDLEPLGQPGTAAAPTTVPL